MTARRFVYGVAASRWWLRRHDGNGIAHVFTQHGWDTTLIDVAPGSVDA